MIAEYFRIVLKNLARRKLRSWLTLIGIIIGISTVVSLIAMGQGLRFVISSQLSSLGTDKLTVQASGGFGPPGTSVIKPLTSDDLKKINAISGVKIAVGRIIKPCTIIFNNHLEVSMASNIPDGEGRKLVEDTLNLKAEKGRLLKDSDKNRVLLGNNYLDKEKFGKEILPGDKIKVNGHDFSVTGILKKTGNFMIDNMVVLNTDDMVSAFSADKDNYDLIVLQIEPESDIGAVKENIERVMRKQRNVKKGSEDFTVETPQAMVEKVSSVLFAVQLFVYIIAGISIVVGGIGIMNAMYMSVIERTKEIGIMKAIGAKNSTIFLLFFIESGLIGTAGGIIGIIAGSGMAYVLTTAGRAFLGSELIAMHLSPVLIAMSLIGSFLVGSIFGVMPAIKSAKLSPVEAIRFKK